MFKALCKYLLISPRKSLVCTEQVNVAGPGSVLECITASLVPGRSRSNRSKHTKAPDQRRKAFQHLPNHFHCLKYLLAQGCFQLTHLRLFCPRQTTMEPSIQGLPFPDLFEIWLLPLLTLPQPPPGFTSWFLGFQLSPILLWILTCPYLALCIGTSLSFLGFHPKELIPVLVFTPWVYNSVQPSQAHFCKTCPCISLAPQPCHEAEVFDRVLRLCDPFSGGAWWLWWSPRLSWGAMDLHPPPHPLHSLPWTCLRGFLRKLKPPFFTFFTEDSHILKSVPWICSCVPACGRSAFTIIVYPHVAVPLHVAAIHSLVPAGGNLVW